MSTNRHWRRYVRFWGPDVEADVEDELRFHLEMKAAELAARGLAPEEAAREARRRFGPVDDVRRWLRRHDRRRLRRAERVEYMDALWQDVRYGARKLAQQPAFTAAVVLVLGLGIGAATAMFSAVDAALLRPFPFQRDDRLLTLEEVWLPSEFSQEKRAPHLADVQAMREVFTHAAAYAPGGLDLTDAAAPQRLRVALVAGDFFGTFGVQPAVGRAFAADEMVRGAPRVAVLSHGLWQRLYGGDSAVLGREIALGGRPHRVVGVMPPTFGFPADAEVWMPLYLPLGMEEYEPFRSFIPSTIVARLAPGATEAQAEARLWTEVQRYRRDPAEHQFTRAELAQPLRESLVGSQRTALLVLLGATGLVLLVVCANVTNLLLARAAARRPEMALRAALGASRGRLVRQLLVESLLLAAGGALLGVVIAVASFGGLGALLPPPLAGTAPLRLDARVLGFALAVATLNGLLFGLWPALGASRADAGTLLKAGAAGAGREGGRLRRLFVVAELSLALMLAIGTGLMLRSLQSLLATDAGVQPERVATLELQLSSVRYPTPASRRAFYEGVLQRLRAVPGVDAAALVTELPLRGEPAVMARVDAEGRTRAAGEEPAFAAFVNVTPDYFRTLGIPLLRGRTIAAVVDSVAPREVVINETLARSLWPSEDAIGRRLVFGHDSLRVVGIATDVRGRALDQPEANPVMYMPLGGSADLALVARGAMSAEVLAGRLREAVRAVDPAQAVYNVRPMETVIRTAIAPRRTNTFLISTFGIVAVLLAAIGVYGVIAYGVARRTREIGIRIALGAQRGDVLRLVVHEGVVLAVIGVALGLAGAWTLRRVIASLLFGITPADPVAFVAAPVALLAIALLASWLPARQAARVSPTEAIRAE